MSTSSRHFIIFVLHVLQELTPLYGLLLQCYFHVSCELVIQVPPLRLPMLEISLSYNEIISMMGGVRLCWCHSVLTISLLPQLFECAEKRIKIIFYIFTTNFPLISQSALFRICLGLYIQVVYAFIRLFFNVKTVNFMNKGESILLRHATQLFFVILFHFEKFIYLVEERTRQSSRL